MLNCIILKITGAPVAVAGIFTNLTIEGTISLSIGAYLTNMVEEGGTDKDAMEKFVDCDESASEHPDVPAGCDVEEPEKLEDDDQHDPR
ncbi:hypothetical protein HWV62_9661 [Athelia sp. TMB]|nr:hypothetical protein HWV62_9661 [Athelia sp. TMB]